jgi:hypothetical protein
VFLGHSIWTWVHWICAGVIKHCFLLNCLRVLYLSLKLPAAFLGDSPGIAESYHLPCHKGASHGLTGGSSTRYQCRAWSGGGFVLLASQSEGLRCTRDWVKCRKTVRDWNTTHQSGMNPCLISDQPQEAEGESDPLPETTSYCSNHGETVPLRFSKRDGSTGLCECVKVRVWHAAQL